MNTDFIELLTHSSIRIKGDIIIYCDPYNVRDALHDADIILITHDHYDHFSPDDIAKVIKSDTCFLVPSSIEAQVRKALGKKVMILSGDAGERFNFDYADIEMVPSYNVNKKFHPESAGYVGYIVCIDGKRIYIAGDTDINDDILNVTCDVALVPVGGTFTMDAKEAAELVNQIGCEAAIPTHYGSVTGSEDAGDVFRSLVDDSIDVKIIKKY
ncbi:L-ascorbate metabolism protein UlaG, beta-lactamase superfamily [Ruminococcaceae bacterium YRB3002]|nr:L-ascorbate metabolism protein UlaG, beta-lactamase superfamily [Ruminococcaceae bacterium YRB3002]